jgi:hypothetical protein
VLFLLLLLLHFELLLVPVGLLLLLLVHVERLLELVGIEGRGSSNGNVGGHRRGCRGWERERSRSSCCRIRDSADQVSRRRIRLLLLLLLREELLGCCDKVRSPSDTSSNASRLLLRGGIIQGLVLRVLRKLGRRDQGLILRLL